MSSYATTRTTDLGPRARNIGRSKTKTMLKGEPSGAAAGFAGSHEHTAHMPSAIACPDWDPGNVNRTLRMGNGSDISRIGFGSRELAL
jgi:hypothetical protein